MSAGKGSVDPFQLLLSGNSVGAVAAYDEIERESPQDFSPANRGLAFLNLGLLDRAMSDFLAAEAADGRASSGRSDSHLKRIGLVHWLRDEENRALEVWGSGVADIDAGRIQFSDLAGGVGVGALLWFGSRGHPLVRTLAESFLRKRSGKEVWPGPIADFLNGAEDEASFLAQAKTSNDRLTARQSCQALFYAGIKAREAGKNAEGLQLLRESCSQGGSSMIEVEYYLGRHEARS